MGQFGALCDKRYGIHINTDKRFGENIKNRKDMEVGQTKRKNRSKTSRKLSRICRPATKYCSML